MFLPKNEAELCLSGRLLALLLESLHPREVDVVKRRFGLGGNEPATLASVAQDPAFRVSRERIRQIEKAALRKLRLSPQYQALRHALDEDAGTVWAEIAQDAPFLKGSQLREARSRLAPVCLFAITLVHRSLLRWLEHYATPLGSGWYVAPLPVAELLSLSSRLLKVLRNNNQPMLFSHLCRTVEAEPMAVHIAIGCDSRMANIRGYVYEGTPTRRRRRRARLHGLLVQRHVRECIPGFVINDVYTAAFPGDPCSIRDLEIVMHDAPHLFLRCAEEGWIALSSRESLPPDTIPLWLGREDSEAPAEDGERARRQDPLNTSTATLAEFIRATLRRDGPLHLGKILALCRSQFGNRYPDSSIPAVIIQGNFVRLAPGVWGLPDHVSLLSENTWPSSLLLSEADCRMYTRSRHAGEPANIYPMWTPAMEYKWVVWAQYAASPDLFASLLFVADPTSWSASEEVQREWLDIKQEVGRYRLREPLKYHLAESLPSLKDLLRIAATAMVRGHISWISANRVVGQRIDSHRAATSLAILIELRLVESARHWQARHATTSACGPFVEKLIADLHEAGCLEWDSDMGREVGRIVVRAGQIPHDSWAPEAELLALRAAFETPDSTVVDGSDRDSSTVYTGGATSQHESTTLNPDIERFLAEP